ncbi:alpha/beta fold hydrolase [Streptacidiphilus rugosus]|uniref:alpha/beta fold hydrolase n=1 Tax=Streptacidiphilus rugosus TaxID=405783 RepID=UPI000567B16A|nr:alpha/beta hydrolase [Streptacidiphilus rugosus]
MNIAFARIRGLRTRILTAGTRGPALVLVHGGGLSADLFAPTVRGLADHFQVAALDLPGCGYSDAPTDTSRPVAALCRDQVLAVADHLGHDRFTVLGSSLGAQVAVLAHLAAPRRVERLVLTASASAFHSAQQIYDSVRDTLTRSTLTAAGQCSDQDVERELRHLAPAARHQLMEILLPFTTAQALPGRTAANTLMLSELMDPHLAGQWHVRDRLHQVTAPTLVVWGGKDPRVPLDSARSAIATLPHHRLELFPDSGHLPFFEEPDRFNALVTEFVTSTAAHHLTDRGVS